MQISQNEKNKCLKSYIIQSKDGYITSKSSSGGMFAELARYVISQEGVVFGCTMVRTDEGFDVKHIYIEDVKDLYKLQGSKYVESRLGNTIKQAKEFLDNGRLVLFSGTPCQIAGLKVYLKQDYANLLTVDLSCTGTPSLDIFNGYIKFLENKYKHKIIKFEFRNKEKLGWTCGNGLITFENGKQKILFNNVSSYLNLFINKKLQKKSCQCCKYSGLDRISDITIADAWGIEQQYTQLLKTKFDKNKGISLVLINTNRGESYLKNIKNLVQEQIDIKTLQKFNGPLNKEIEKKFDEKYIKAFTNGNYTGIDNIFKKSLGLNFYYYNIKNHIPKFIKNIIKLLIPKKIDCLLLTLYCLPNYGSLLTAYALSKTISNIGFSNQIIHYGNLYGYGKSFVKKYLKLTKRCINNKDFTSLNNLTDTFILGSDNLLDFSSATLGFTSRSLLNFANENKKKIMISGSLGNWDGTTKTQEEKDYIRSLLSRFEYISTREEKGKNVFKTEYDIEADWINDPVFYLEYSDYEELIKNADLNITENTIMNYILYPNNETEKMVNFLKEKYNACEVKFAGNENVSSDNKNDSVENWLYAIKNSKIIITDSFHCICFALIFNKPFICIKNTHATVRFTSLFNKLGINVKLTETLDDIKENEESLDFQKVNENIKTIREFAQTKLMEILYRENKKNKDTVFFTQINKKYFPYSDYWYKKSKIFYYTIILSIILPIKRYLNDKKLKR